MSASTSLPSGWNTALIGDVCSLATGGTPKSSEKSYYQGGTIKWLVSGDVHQREIYDCRGRITEAGLNNSNARPLPVGSVIIALNGQGKTRGTVAMLQTEATCNQSLVSINPRNRSDLLSEFLFWNLRGRYEEIRRMTGDDGNDRRGLNMPLIRGIRVPVPPLDEQKRIVAVLDQAFAALDCASANIEANLTASINIPGAWLQRLFEGSEAWSTHALADVCQNLDRLRVPITKGDREPGDIPYYGASGVVDHVKGHLFDEDLLLVSEDGANLLARTYPIAFSISGKAWVNNHAHVLRFDDSTTQEFVRLYLNSISLKPYVTGMAQPKLNQAALNGIPVPMPSPEVREEIVRKAHQISVEAERAAGIYRAQRTDVDVLRQSLLQAAFSGQLT